MTVFARAECTARGVNLIMEKVWPKAITKSFVLVIGAREKTLLVVAKSDGSIATAVSEKLRVLVH